MEEQKHKILIVDDDPFVRDMLACIFESGNYSVETAADGHEALQKTSLDKDISLVVSDMNMPKINGLELLNGIRKINAELPVIILTGNNEIAVAIEAMNSGANAYLLKDENIQDAILLCVKEVFEKQELKILNRRLMDELIQKNKEVKKSYIEMQGAYSELKKAQAQMLQQEKLASIGQLAAGVAHEINNPMGFIANNLRMFEKYIGKLKEFILAQSEAVTSLNANKPLSSIEETRSKMKIDYILVDALELLKESLDGAERVKKIVQDLKSFSNVDAAEYLLSDINLCLEDTSSILSNVFRDRITVQKDYGDIPQISCNRGQINQAFLNVLLNAAQAIQDQGEIIIRTWQDKGRICISISDTGCGIAEENIKRIFEPFFTTKDVGKGQGLGLTIAYDIIKKHNGEIIIQSEVGKGTVFTLKVPVADK